MSVLSLATTQVNIYRVTTTQDVYGAYRETYTIVYCNVPARVNYKTGQESLTNGKIQNNPIYRIYLPKQLTIYHSDVIVDRFRDWYYDILYINKMDRKHHLQIDTKKSNGMINPQGWTWGYNGSALTTLEESWKTWTEDESFIQAANTGDYGELNVVGLDKFVSPPKDTGDTDSKTVALSYDDYDICTSNFNKLIWWRGSNTPFNQDNSIIPWTLYAGSFTTTYRYLQVRVGIYI